MTPYKEFEEKVFNWLMKKHIEDPAFTFSVRRKASKGAELNYFIGTENSKYFVTSFWYISVAYPGNAAELINLLFKLNDKGYQYYFRFLQTKTPQNKQNQYGLDFIQQLKPIVRQEFRTYFESREDSKMESFGFSSPQEYYNSPDDLLKDVDADIKKIIPIVDEQLRIMKEVHPDFIAHRYSEKDFIGMIADLEKRRDKHSVMEQTMKSIDKTDKKLIIIPPFKPFLNQILFGPPGTGKTYNTINKALEILHEPLEGKSRKEIKKNFNTRLDKEEIVFVTFHQSMSYEDFIEGIKPEEPKQEGHHVNYKIIDGVFKKACAMAAYNCYKLFIESNKQAANYSFDDLYEAFINYVQERLDKNDAPVYKTLKGKDVEIKEINRNDSIIARAKNSIASYSAPLTKENMQKLYDTFKSIKEIENLKQVKDTVQITPRITEFYAVFKGLKDFETTYKPDEYISESKEFEDLNIDEIQKKFNANVYDEAIKKYGEEAKAVVLIIDEINRGNVSQIFGELITLIEEDKRLGNDESLKITLPYSKRKFGVPPNLYIIGTMNTADRSVEALDTALRRRFNFVEKPPQPDKINRYFAEYYCDGFIDMYDIGWKDEPWVSFEKNVMSFMIDPDRYWSIDERKFGTSIDPEDFVSSYENIEKLFKDEGVIFIPVAILIKINQRLIKLLDKDHQIGHSYFMAVKNLEDLKQVFQNKILPLLQEYFYGDFGKIGLVLGKGFFEIQGISDENIFAEFDDYDASQFAEKPIYKLKDITKMHSDEFKTAIETLLK